MGCCLGTTSRPPNPAPHRRHHHQKPNSLPQIKPKTYVEKPETRSPPRLLEAEEETVKEVLSETPIPKLIPAAESTPQDNANVSVLTPKQVEVLDEQPKKQPEPAVSEVSQLSEPCPAISESYSYSTTTTATTIAEAREDEVTSTRKMDLKGSSSRVRRRLPPPRRTPEPAGGKRNRTTEMTSSAAFRGRESGQMRTMQRGSGGVPSGVRRETVSSRSRSPATRNVGGGVSRPGRGKSPAKAVAGRGGGGSSNSASASVEDSERKKKVKEAKEEALAARKAEEVKEEERSDEDGGVSQPPQQEEGKESLDNPMVSLECFIFV